MAYWIIVKNYSVQKSFNNMGNANDAILSWENHIKMQMHVSKELQWRVPATGGGCQLLVEGASWLR